MISRNFSTQLTESHASKVSVSFVRSFDLETPAEPTTYTGLESEQEVLPRVMLPPDSMTSLEITRGKGRAWCLVRSRVIVTSRFWELPFLGNGKNCLRESFFVTTQFSFCKHVRDVCLENNEN